MGGMNSDSDMGGIFEEMHKRHAARDQQSGMAKASSSAQTRSEHKAKLAKKKNDEAVKRALAKKAHEQKVAAARKAARKAAARKAKAAARKAKAAAARKAAMQKADSSRQHATMLTPHILSEHHQPSIPHHRTHMLSAGVFGSHNVKKAHRKKTVHKVKVSKPKSNPMNILLAPTAKRQDKAGLSLTALAGDALQSSDEEEEKQAAAKQAKKEAKKK